MCLPTFKFIVKGNCTLLNISIHSVEIKRYRLRKKMNLTRSQGIVEYIMTL